MKYLTLLQMTSILARRAGPALALLTAGGISAPALANDEATKATASDYSEAGTIMVTARRRAENLLEVPLAISAMTSDQLRQSGTEGLEDLAKTTPGLSFQSIGGTYQSPVIRGLAQVDQTAQIGNVGVFLDGVYLNNRSGLEFGSLDLERVEVVKGPQSALYGRNTFSGAINYVTKDAKLGEFDGYVTAEIGDYNRRSIQGSVSVPIGDAVAVRAFGSIGKFDGTIKNERDGGRLGGYDKRANYGLSVLIEPTSRLSLKLFGMRVDVDERQAAYSFIPTSENNCGSFSPNAPTGPRYTLFCGKLPTPETVNLDNNIGTGLTGHSYLAYAKADYDMDFATLSASYAYTEAAFGQNNDAIADPNAISLPLFPGSPLSQQSFLEAVTAGSYEHSVDVKLASPDTGTFKWMVGANYYDSSVTDVLEVKYAALNDLSRIIPFFGSGKSNHTKGFGLYGQVGFELTPELSVTAEGRYSHEKVNFEGMTLNDGNYITGIKGSETYKYFNPRLTVDYKISPDMMFYATAAKGNKIGGFNAAAFGREEFTFNPESNWTYEAGLKGTLLNRKLVYTANVFFVDWTDIQVQSYIAASQTSIVTNNRGATSKGIELDASYNFDRLNSIRIGAAVIDPKYKKGTIDGEITAYCGLLTGTSIPQAGCSDDVGGNQLARTTKTQFSISANTGFALTDTYDFFLRGDFSYQDRKTSQSLGQDSQGDISLLNVRAGVSSSKVDLSFWVKNLLDAKYLGRATTSSSIPDGGPTAGIAQVRLYPGERRTMGARLTLRY